MNLRLGPGSTEMGFGHVDLLWICSGFYGGSHRLAHAFRASGCEERAECETLGGSGCREGSLRGAWFTISTLRLKDLPDLCNASFKSEEISAKHQSSPVSSRRK